MLPNLFNSTMVQLKDSDGLVPVLRFSFFQFHNGSIKSKIAEINAKYDKLFNSTMVQLKGLWAEWQLPSI